MPLSWKEIVQDYIIKYSDKIRSITNPLRTRLDVGYFTYHRIDAQGKYTVLVDRPDWAEHYVGTRYYLDDPYLRHPDVYRSGYCSIQSHGSEEFKKKILHDGKEVFNLDYSVLLIEKKSDSVEFFGFSANQGKSRLEEVVLNCPSFLKTFATHFKKELSPIILQMQKEAGSLIDLKGKDFFTKDPIHPSPKIDALLKECGNAPLVSAAATLSSQEKKCLQGICHGKSAKEIAQDLLLSHRTVESYIENVKNKLSCTTKQELFMIAKKFENFSLLP
jgi:DNA-binding CsgD family transcriptional regulator